MLIELQREKKELLRDKQPEKPNKLLEMKREDSRLRRKKPDLQEKSRETRKRKNLRLSRLSSTNFLPILWLRPRPTAKMLLSFLTSSMECKFRLRLTCLIWLTSLRSTTTQLQLTKRADLIHSRDTMLVSEM